METTLHVLQCPHPTVTLLWDTELNKLGTWMTENDGDPNLIQQLIGRLLTWQRNAPLLDNNAPSLLLRHAITHQNRLGWHNLIAGFFTREWVQVQANHLLSLNSNKSASLWWSKVQRKLWNIIKTLWEHQNTQVHARNGNTIHITEQNDLNKAITHEWETGLGDLPPSYSSLFSKSAEHHLQDTYQRQRQWLASVWLAKERCNSNLHLIDSTNTAFQRFLQWKKRKRHVFENDSE